MGPDSTAGRRPFTPKSLDRMLERIQRANTTLSKASDLTMVGVAAMLSLADLAVWLTDPEVDKGRLTFSIALLVPCLGALCTAAVGLQRRHLAVAVTTIAAVSMALTLATSIIETSLPPSFAALFALAVLTTTVLRRAPSGAHRRTPRTRPRAA